MFEQPAEQTPWFRSWPVLLAASILLPPVGLILLLTNRNFDVQVKALGSVLILLLGALYAFLIFGPSEGPNTADHFDALERHRAAQREAAGAAGAQSLDTAAQPAEGVAAAQTGMGDAASAAAPAEGQPVAEAAPGGAPAAPAPAPSTGAARRAYWSDFRGPGRAGRYDERPIKTAWPAAGLPLLWKQPIGGGYASFTVADGVAYTIEQRREQEVVAAYQLDTGRELWTNSWNAFFRESMGGDGPRATPVWDSGRVYALGASGELRCLDARTGRVVWSKNILTENGASNIQWGMAASPLIVDDKVIVMPGGTSGRSVVAYHKATGAPVWRAMNDVASYTSPALVTLAGRRQVLVVTARRAAGLDPADGSVLWDFPWSNSAGINVAQPLVVSPNQFFISAGYGKGAALVEVSRTGQAYAARAVWENSSMRNQFNSSVLHDGHVYGFSEKILTCVEAATGQRKWQARGYGQGQVVLASGHLIVTTDEGEVALVAATPEGHREVARFRALQGRTWNNPAIADGRLLVRNATEMACYKLTD
jgi:outer membrane protein assembly factor BamB